MTSVTQGGSSETDLRGGLPGEVPEQEQPHWTLRGQCPFMCSTLMLGCLLSSQPPHGYSNPGAAEQESNTIQQLLPDTPSVSPACPRGFALVRRSPTNTQADSHSPRSTRDVRCGRDTQRPSGLGRTRVASRNQATL